MSDWSHGYNVSLGYTYGFYRELAPDWLDLCVQVAGYAAPARRGSGEFRYLELGAGQGLGLALLAAANPEGEFLGVDFNPEHIAHANALVASGGLTNVRFVEGDFAALAQQWPDDFGQFDYVTLHGIYSWVQHPVRRSLVAMLGQGLVPGGLAYNSYNTNPGWLTTAPFQHLSRRLQVVNNTPGPQAIDAAVALFDELAEANAAIFSALPGLKGRVASVRGQNRNYLVQEYLHEEWHPLWFSEVANEMADAKLGYIGPATLPELLLPGVLPEKARSIIAAQGDPALRQEIQDCAINQSFRRDIYCRGPRRSFQHPFQAAAGAVFHLIAMPEPEPLKVGSSFGELTLSHDVFGPIVAALESGPKTFGDIVMLRALQQHGQAGVTQALLLLLHNGAIAIGKRAHAGGNSEALNVAIARSVCEGAPYGYLAASALGGALTASDIDCMMVDVALTEGAADVATVSRGLSARLTRLGRSLADNGARLEGPALDERLASLAQTFVNEQLPRWRRLGAVS